MRKEYYKGKTWVIMGLIWGAFMFLMLSVIFPYFTKEEINQKSLLIGIVTWTIGGLLYGYTMKIYYRKRNKKK